MFQAVNATPEKVKIPSKKAATTPVVAQDMTQSTLIPPNGTTISSKFVPAHQGVEAESRKIPAVAKAAEPVAVMPNQVPAAPTIASSARNPFPRMPSLVTIVNAPPIATSTRDNRRSIVEDLAKQRAAIIGEHVYKTRFQSKSGLVENFRKLSISDTHIAASADKANSPPAIAMSNPFGIPKPASSRPTGPTLPNFLQQAASIDAGAAARAQYGGLVNAGEPAPRPSRTMTITSMFAPEATTRPLSSGTRNRDTSVARSGPSIPTFLQGASASQDPGAAARKQYSGKGLDPLEIARTRGL